MALGAARETSELTHGSTKPPPEGKGWRHTSHEDSASVVNGREDPAPKARDAGWSIEGTSIAKGRHGRCGRRAWGKGRHRDPRKASCSNRKQLTTSRPAPFPTHPAPIPQQPWRSSPVEVAGRKPSRGRGAENHEDRNNEACSASRCVAGDCLPWERKLPQQTDPRNASGRRRHFRDPELVGVRTS